MKPRKLAYMFLTLFFLALTACGTKPAEVTPPCDPTILAKMAAFVTAMANAGLAAITQMGTADSVYLASGSQTAVETARQAGLKVSSTNDISAWLKYAGFKPNGVEHGLDVYTRPENWNSVNGCGPLPVLSPGGSLPMAGASAIVIGGLLVIGGLWWKRRGHGQDEQEEGSGSLVPGGAHA